MMEWRTQFLHWPKSQAMSLWDLNIQAHAALGPEWGEAMSKWKHVNKNASCNCFLLFERRITCNKCYTSTSVIQQLAGIGLSWVCLQETTYATALRAPRCPAFSWAMTFNSRRRFTSCIKCRIGDTINQGILESRSDQTCSSYQVVTGTRWGGSFESRIWL